MSLDYIRSYYGVPAEVGTRVIVDGEPGVITGFHDARLMVQLDGQPFPVTAHPTWRVTYLPTSPSLPEEVQP